MWLPNTYALNRASDYQLGIVLLDSTGMPFSISGASSISLLLKNSDATILNVPAATGMSWGYGNTMYCYVFNISQAQMANLPLGRIPIEALISYGSITNKVTLYGQLTLTDAII